MSAVLAVESATVCESCRLRPAVTSVTVGDAAPFAVCAGCAPARQARPLAAAPGRDADDPAAVDWHGAVRLPVDLADAWVIVGGLVVTTATALAGWATAGPVGLAAGGLGSVVVVVGLDLRRGRP